MNEMTVYAVGSLYAPGRTSWPEAIEYNFRQGIHELRIFLPNLTRFEINAGRRAPIELALVRDLPVILLLFRIDGLLNWSDAPYTWHMVPQEDRNMPEKLDFDAGERNLMSVVLIDAATGIVQALRHFTMSPGFSKELYRAITVQAVSPFNQELYDRHLAGIRQEVPAQLVSRAIAICKAGD